MGEDDGFEVPPPDHDWEEQKDWLRDKIAEAEEQKFDDENALRSSKTKAHRLFIRTLAILGILTLITIWIALIAIFGSYVIHLLMPECWYWMSPEKIQKLETTLFSGGVGAVLVSFLRSHLDRLFQRD